MTPVLKLVLFMGIVTWLTLLVSSLVRVKGWTLRLGMMVWPLL